MSQTLTVALAALQAATTESHAAEWAAEIRLSAVPPMLEGASKAVSGMPNQAAAIAVNGDVTRRFAAAAATVALASALTVAFRPSAPPQPESTITIVPQPLSLALVARAADVIDRLGVTTHNNYTDGQYADTSRVIASLRFLGLHHIRDTNFRPEDQGQNALAEMGRQGIRVTAYLRSGTSPAVQVARLKRFLAVGPLGLAMIEGFNEINNEPLVRGNPAENERAAQLFMSEFYALARADDLLKNIPIAGFTNYPESVSRSDLIAIHPYAKQGLQPRGTIESGLNAQRAAQAADGSRPDADKPFIITETGYHTTRVVQPDWESVDETTQAKFILNTYTAALSLGCLRTFVYQLFDGYPDPKGDDRERHFGLFRFDYSPKPAAMALASFTALLKDEGATAATFQPGALGVTVSGAPPTGRSFLVAKSDGTFLVVTWAEGDCWDEATHRPTAAPVFAQTIAFGRSFRRVEVFDPVAGAAATATSANARSITVPVSDRPLVVRLSR